MKSFLKVYWQFDGKTGEFVFDYPLGDDELEYMKENDCLPYIWDEGNYACDCNRSDFFGLPDMDCGDTIKITKWEIVSSVPVR